MMVKYPECAAELERLLSEDQKVWKSFWRTYFDKQNTPLFRKEFDKVRAKQRRHAERMLNILYKIGEPTLSNIGTKAAQAMSILALHDSIDVLRSVLGAFISCYEHNKRDVYYQVIPSMVDRVRLLERKPQIFGTQWDFDENNYPFLPTVEDFSHVNDRRKEYGLEPLHWPKSLAIPESKQPWLKRPLSEAVMRDISEEEFRRDYQPYLDA